MREMLETLRLPGEAQQIDRIAETFASVYFASKPGKYRYLWYHFIAEIYFTAHFQLKSKLKMLFMSWHSRSLCLTLINTILKSGQVQPSCYPSSIAHNILETDGNRGLPTESEGTEWRRRFFIRVPSMGYPNPHLLWLTFSSNTFMTRYASVKSLCQRSILAS